MSFRVLVIPEDPTYNGYILRPLAETMLAEAGRPNARVTVLANPKLDGYDHAVQAIKTLSNYRNLLEMCPELKEPDRHLRDLVR